MAKIKACERFSNVGIVIFAIFLIYGCATTKNVASHLEFDDSNVSKIYVGMSLPEFEAIFGRPDISYSMVCGKKTGRAWEGLVYKFYTVRDPMYRYAGRRRTNTFVFYSGSNPPVLNNWRIEKVYRISPKKSRRTNL